MVIKWYWKWGDGNGGDIDFIEGGKGVIRVIIWNIFFFLCIMKFYYFIIYSGNEYRFKELEFLLFL